jgi:hypothetical protein
MPIKINDSNSLVNVTNIGHKDMSAKNSKKQAQQYLAEL